MCTILIQNFNDHFRAKKEKEERKQRGEDTVSDEDNDDSLEGDPFKRLDYEELQKKVRL